MFILVDGNKLHVPYANLNRCSVQLKCFYCGERISNAPKPYGSHNKELSEDTYRNHNHFCVEWGSNGQSMLFHPRCAEEFALHLIKDVRSGEDFLSNNK